MAGLPPPPEHGLLLYRSGTAANENLDSYLDILCVAKYMVGVLIILSGPKSVPREAGLACGLVRASSLSGRCPGGRFLFFSGLSPGSSARVISLGLIWALRCLPCTTFHPLSILCLSKGQLVSLNHGTPCPPQGFCTCSVFSLNPSSLCSFPAHLLLTLQNLAQMSLLQRGPP